MGFGSGQEGQGIVNGEYAESLTVATDTSAKLTVGSGFDPTDVKFVCEGIADIANGSQIEALNASKITSGTIGNAYLPATIDVTNIWFLCCIWWRW